ncbi:HTH-type transcriptional regulator GltC [Aquimixticola soesokkakensis]|uniref:HTH-type transcriptional regulator GltC n=1 Tax=Aquimixticola soesokkakensis TaxID=1519096 RepID=A0A1Y5TJY1_9RHOB|nr:LysR family transcriptional regulator [Aquimixticola soesokkakensis]SLN66032.1 HTH-type transcriptional regulator GltC [Aquimixticola soesokkakensis]
MQWDDLRIFLAVARTESLSGAGRVLKNDPATVGRRITRLEEDLGATLFTKSPQGYALTTEGERLLAHAETAETAVRAGADDVAGRSDQLSGVIRLGAPDGCANYLLPGVCNRISLEHPDLEIQVVALPRVFNLSKREADLAIAVSAPVAGRLTVQKITDYKLSLAASRRYLRRAGPLESLDDLKNHRVVGYIPDMIFDKELDYLAETGTERAGLASNSVAVQFNFLRAGAGVGIVHDFALPSAPILNRVLTNAFSLTRAFYLIRYADDRKVERLNRFAALLTEYTREEVQRLESATTDD